MINNYMFLASVCDNIVVLRVVLFLKTLLDAVLFIVPMGLIVMVSFDFAKNVIANREDDMRKNLGLTFKRLIYAVIIFLIPTITEFTVGMMAGAGTEYYDCLNVSSEIISKKLAEGKATCVGEYEWNESIGSCVKKIKLPTSSPNITATDDYIVSGGSTSSNSSVVSSANSTSNLHYYNQGDYSNVAFCKSGKTVRSSGCGATSISIMTTSFSSPEYDPKYVATWLCSNGHGNGGLHANWFDKQILKDKFNLNVEELFDSGSSVYQGNAGKKYDESKGNKILNAVKSGKGVVLYIPGHYVAVGNNTSCSNEEVYLYEVGSHSKCGCYTMQELWNVTYNNKNRCTNNGNCGWKAAWAYSPR